MDDFASKMRNFLQDPRQMAGFHGLNIYINWFNKPQKTPFMGKRSIHIINKITLGLFLRLLIEQDGILLV